MKIIGLLYILKNHNLCISIILILAFLLGINISHIYYEELLKTNVYLKIVDILNRAYPGAASSHNRGSQGAPSSQGGGNQLCLTTDIWFHS